MCIWCVLHGKTLSLKELPSCDSTFSLPSSFFEDEGVTLENLIDWDTVENLPDALSSAVPESIIPLKTTGDGNCLLHAVSRAIWGVELYFELLRVKLHEELKNNITWYKKAAKEFTEEDWERVLNNAARTGAHLEFIHTLALSNVIKRPIILYASDRDTELFGQGESGVAATFVPSRVGSTACVQRPIILAWQTTHKNHYVPIVGISGRRNIEWPLLKPAFPDGLSEGEDASTYIHLEAEIVNPPVVQLLEDQKKELQKRKEDEKKLLEGLQDTLRRVMKDQQGGKKRFFEEDEEEEEEEDEEEEMMEKGGLDSIMRQMKDEGEDLEDAVIAPPGSLIRTPNGFLRVPSDRAWVLTYSKNKDKKKKKTERRRKEEEFKKRLLALSDALEEQANGEKSKQRHKGRAWDFVFPVKLSQDSPPLKIACNKGDNPAEVAEQFVQEEGLNPTFIPKIAAFLAQNMAAAQAGDDKKPTRPPAPKGSTIPLADPAPVLYKTGRFDGILKAIGDINTQLAANESTKKLAMTPEEGMLLKHTINTLQAITAYNTSTFVLDEYRILLKLMSWPSEKLYPVLDVARLMILHPKAADHFRIEHAKGNSFFVQLLRLIQGGKGANATNTLLVMKFICNMFASEELKAVARENYEIILKVCFACVETDNKNVRLCLANIVVNYATQIALKDMKFLLLPLLRQLLSGEEDPGSLFSILAALGMLMYNDWDITDLVDKYGMCELVEKHVSSGEEKVAGCARDILLLIQWRRGG